MGYAIIYSLRADSTVSAEERKGEELTVEKNLLLPFRSSALTVESARMLIIQRIFILKNQRIIMTF